jgi:hypothetical protein
MHAKLTILIAFLLLVSPNVFAADTEETRAQDAEPSAEADDGSDEPSSGPRKMSGMSVLGNEEAPKSLVIIPWKSSELGDDISLSDTLDDRARPVDKEVFMRELSFYEIRSGE